MSTENQKELFKTYCSFFPEVELPVTLSEEYTPIFNKYNKALPEELIKTFILDEKMFFGDEEDTDLSEEIEEYVPCLSLPSQKGYTALVYWKAGLLKYEYIIHTYDQNGQSIARQVIASTTSDGKNIRQIVATIDPDLEIYIIGGDTDNPANYDPERSKAFSLEITPTGHFIHHFEEN
jgi:hypothetical protein